MAPRRAKGSLTRRAVLAAGVGATRPAAYAATVAPAGLAATGAAAGRRYGCAVRLDQLAADADVLAAVRRECAVLTPEVELKWAVIEPEEGRLDFRGADALAAIAADGGKRMRGHTLIWHRSVPDWAKAALASGRDWRIVARYFASVMPRYAGIVDQWDVVNEPVLPGARPDGLRPSPWLDAFGPGYVARALHEARNCAPRSRLFVNEYGLEYDDGEGRERRAALLKLLNGLKASGVPLDGLGLQSHLDLRRGPIAAEAVTGFCREVSSLGLEVAVTELDVKEADYVAPAPERDRQVADQTRRYLDAVLAGADVRTVSTWGLSDRYSWLRVEPSDYARFPGAWTHGDGPGLNRGLPLDAALKPTPMYAALRDALGRRPQKLR